MVIPKIIFFNFK